MGLIDDIKNEAKGNRTIIQSSEAAELSKIFNKMFYLEKKPEEEAEFVKQVMTRGLESQERIGLHASALIKSDKEFCLRQQVLSLVYKQLQGDQIPVGLKKIFEEGNAIHEKWQRMLIRAGYSSVSELDVTQFNKKYQISFTPDIICSIPEFYDGKMVGEIKSVNTFQFQKMIRHPSAHKQLQWYMGLSIAKAKKEGTWNGKDYLKGFVLCEDKNTQDFKLEVYDYNKEEISIPIKRAKETKLGYEKLINENKIVKRPDGCNTFDCKRCSKCPMRDACWNVGMGKVKIK